MGVALSASLNRFRFLFRFAFIVFMCAPLAGLATTVRLQTSLGAIDIELFDSAAPLTVANFLNYVNSGAYNNSFIHRSVSRFIIQGGGYTWDGAKRTATKIPAGAAVANEFSAGRSNLRGTVAMAKITGDPNSATTEWFFNLADNAANLDAQNGGFTVFGQVTASGMAVVDTIAALPVGNAGGSFTSLPLASTPASGSVQQENLVMVTSVSTLAPPAAASDSDRVFNYLESTYRQYLAPSGAQSDTASGYYYRYYQDTGSYVGTSNDVLYYLGPLFDGVTPLGTLADWLATAARAGF